MGLAAVAAGSTPAFGASWEMRPEVALTGGYETNRQLFAEDPAGVGVGRIAGGLSLARATERYRIQGIGRVEYLGFTGDTRRLKNRDNELLDLRARYEWDRASVGPRLNWRRDTVFRNISVITDPGDPGLDPGGSVDDALVQQDVRRNRLRLDLPFSYRWSDRSTVGVGYGFRAGLFEDVPEGVNLADYWEHRVQASYRYRLSPRDAVGLRGIVTFYDSEQDRSADNYEILANYTRRMSEITTLFASAGARRTQATINGRDKSNNGFVGEIGVRQRLSRLRYTLKYEHRLYPSGTATLVNTDQVRGKVFYALGERWGTGLQVRWFDTERLSGEPSRSNRRYFEIRPTVSYQWSPDLSVELYYRYRWQDRKDLDETADSHAVFLNLRWSRLQVLDNL